MDLLFGEGSLTREDEQEQHHDQLVNANFHFATTKTIEVFVNNTNLTFLSFLYKINIEVS